MFNPFDAMEREIEKIDLFLQASRQACEEHGVKYPAITARIIAVRRGRFSDIDDFRKVVLDTKSLIYLSIAEKNPDTVPVLKTLDDSVAALVSGGFRGITLTLDRDNRTPGA